MNRTLRPIALPVFLVLLHVALLFPGFFAPYDFAAQNRDLPFAPPTKLHFVDPAGGFHLWPFVHPFQDNADADGVYAEDLTQSYPLRLFVDGDPYKVAGLWTAHIHLFGVQSPGQIFLFGTDDFGRDELSRMLFGGRISLFAGILGATIAISAGAAMGLIAGFFGGWRDAVIMRVSELFVALPWLYLLFAVRALLPLRVKSTDAFLLLVSIVGLVGWARPARLVRGIVLAAKERNFVLAARAMGASNAHVLRHHILPETYGVLLTTAALLVPQFILAEVTLSFLGLGVGEPIPSWGNLLAPLQRYSVLTSYWWMYLPAVALVFLFLTYHWASTTLQSKTAEVRLSLAKDVRMLCQLAVVAALACTNFSASLHAPQDFATVPGEAGEPGGKLVVALRSEPKTLNPILSVDATSREVIGTMNADLIHINRETQRTEPALAKSWKISPDGKQFVLQLRKGVKFSDGTPFTADDVVFSFNLYLDEALHSPQRDLLIIDDKPIVVRKLSDFAVEFDLAKPYGPSERLFDGLAILPRHLLEKSYREGKLAQSWGITAKPEDFSGLGAFKLKTYTPGQQLVLERNPNYWKKDSAGKPLPYLAELTFVFVANEDAQIIKFQSGDTDLLERSNADNFAVMQKDATAKGECLRDLGPGLEFQFLVFNQNQLDPAKYHDLAAKQAWFRDLKFRAAVSLAMDRKGMTRLVYGGKATPIWGNVTPGDRLWLNTSLSHPERSIVDARKLLQTAGYSWNSDGSLLDSQKRPVNFTIMVSSSNAQRSKLAALAQDDLKQLGMDVQVVPTEFRALVDRVLNSKDYEAVLMNLVNGDTDPTPEMNLWLSGGETHLWDLGEKKPATAWEAEVDHLMESQMTTTDPAVRKKLYDRVQQLAAENLPLIFLVSPNILVAAQSKVGNFHPAILEPYVLWNADQLFLRRPGAAKCP